VAGWTAPKASGSISEAVTAGTTDLGWRCAELHEAFRRIGTSGIPPQEFVLQAHGALRKVFPEADILVYAVPDLLSAVATVGASSASPEALCRLADYVLRQASIQYIRDTGAVGRPEAAALAAAGITAAVGIPCLGRDGPVAAIVLGRRSSLTLSDTDLLSLAAVGAHLGTGLHAALTRAALERSYQVLQAAQGQRVSSERLAALGQMAAGVAHDFNNMLASIMVRAELLRQLLSDPKLIAHVEVIERTAHDGARTVRRLQEFTRPANGSSFQPLDLNGAVKESLEITKSRWKDDAHLAGIHIELETDFGKLPPVLGEASEIREVITNLIVNAVDAMPNGGRLRFVTRHLAKEHRVELSVADTGVGMTEDVQAHIFDPFFSTKGTKGSGLGLSVSYGIIKRHRGQIRVESKPGIGTTFTMLLPCTAETEQTPAMAPPEAQAACSGPLRLLVIDDDEGFRVSLYTALQREGHFVAVASSGEEGLRLFRISTFDVVLTDLGMPGLSGWDVAQAVKQARPRTPVILITGWGVTLTEEDRHRPEVDAILAKPVTAKAILQALSKLPVERPNSGDGGQRPNGRGRGK
jgi:signal transduction histidine kinase/ActR/RegA family two-component response regulator